MKKQLFFAFISVLVLISVFVISSCSSSDPIAEDTKVEDNPNFNPATNEVITKFVFNVSNGNDATTRQTAEITQATSSAVFRGIDDANLLFFQEAAADGTPVTNDGLEVKKSYNMARVATAASLSNDNSRRVLEMSLPLNSNKMLFYGRAIRNSESPASHGIYGHLSDYNIGDALDGIYFSLAKCLETDQKAEFLSVENLLAGVISCILNVNRGTAAIAATDVPETGAPAYGFAIPATLYPNMPWSAYTANKDAQGNPQSPISPYGALTELENKMYKVYKELTTIQEAELRNASGPALKSTVLAIWNIINGVRCATPTNQPEALAKYMAQLVHVELQKYFTATTTSSAGSFVDQTIIDVEIKSAQNLIDAFAADSYWPTATAGDKPTGFDNITNLTSDDLGQFPAQYELPQGSTHIKFDETKKTFYYVQNFNSSAVGGATFTVDDYYHPAELLYFGNGPLRVSEKEKRVADYPQTVTAWNSESATSWGTDWTTSHIQSTTRSVALKNDINYGTSLLKLTVGYNSSSITDNNKAIQARDYGVVEEDKVITVSDETFKLVGVIIGDQWPTVGWNFLPMTYTGDPNYRKGYIYDSVISNEGKIPGSTSSTSEPNYTLVFDNYVDMTVASPADPTNKQSKVYIALEFQNNSGVDFFGKDNLIANGSNFYLIGELDPTTKQGPKLPVYHALPPYDKHDNSDATRTVPRVFIQDHMTTANFKIGVNSLKYAYLTVPDLRSSSVTLGLSVDLKWESGLDFNGIILGGN